MKRKRINVVGIVLPLLVVAVAGAAASKALPSAAVPGGWASPAGASALTVQAAAPLTLVGSGFTYQGTLKNNGSPANGNYDFWFTLYDAPSGGSPVFGAIDRNNVPVTDGLFAVTLDFGSASFDGNARYLEIAVRQSGGGTYSTLSPRQEITPVPYALFALKTAPYKNMVTVAYAGGQFTSIQAALDSITDASFVNRYLVWVGPGIYPERVTMKQWVDIEGSGERTTWITSSGNPGQFTGTVIGAANAELRSLTVESTGGNTFAVAIYLPEATNLLHVTARASGAFQTNAAVYNASSSPSINNLTAVVSGAATESIGVYNDGASPRIVASDISASGASIAQGVFSRGSGTVTIENCKITASTPIFLHPGVTVRVGASQLAGGPVSSAGTLTCTGSYDENYVSPGLNVCP